MWIIQDKVFGEETNSLVEALGNNNIQYKIVKDSSYPLYGRAIIRGSIDFVKSYRHPFTDYFPGGLLTLENYKCSNYYKFFKNRMLNYEYIMLPWWNLKDKKDLVFKAFPDSEKFFIRPNSGKKIFTGTTISKKWWDKELDIISSLPSSNIQDSDLILVSSYKEILAEYRLLMHKDHLIDYSIYSGENQFTEDVFINFMASSTTYFPDILYTVDLAVTENSVKYLELNSFVSAGLYDMNYDKIVKYIESIK